MRIGAGTGIVSLTLASLRPQSTSTDTQMDKIIATDVGKHAFPSFQLYSKHCIESAIPLLSYNISFNQSLYPNNVPHTDVLDWNEELSKSVKSLGKIDAILYGWSSQHVNLLFSFEKK